MDGGIPPKGLLKYFRAEHAASWRDKPLQKQVTKRSSGTPFEFWSVKPFYF
jgi:hypothetical protein